jgi:hypothetical protein
MKIKNGSSILCEYVSVSTICDKSPTHAAGLPFYPLPEEMPECQKNTERGVEQTDDPTAEDKPLTYPAVIASLSLVECYFELRYKNTNDTVASVGNRYT